MAVTYAIVQTGGKQYRAEPGGTLRVEKLEVELGNTVELSDVLLVRSESGMRVGTPYVPGAKVVAEVIRQAKGAKIIGFKYKPKKNERKRYGHRQQYTWLRVKEIIEGA
ncbi:MAG: 50S ribosomal protein L21 [candidate division WOR-3 bacterium]